MTLLAASTNGWKGTAIAITLPQSPSRLIVADRCITEYGVSYDEYREVAEKVDSLGHGVDWLAPKAKDIFDFFGRGKQKAHLRKMRMFAGEHSPQTEDA